jgi:hypothetical protein
MTFLAIFLPPLYFLAKKNWVGFAGTSLLFILAIYCCCTIVLAPLLVPFWVVASVWALLNRRLSLKRQSVNVGIQPNERP